MKEVAPEECKKLQLNILINVAKFCDDHDIKYSLAYGTLIGAIRHKGFIPWDDDIDIIMMRDDYERFVETYNDNKYQLIDGAYKPNHLHVVISDMSTFLVSEKRSFRKFNKGGVWVDIFPLDYVPDNTKKYKAFMMRIWMFCKMQRCGELTDPKAKLVFNLAHPFLWPFKHWFGKLAKDSMQIYNSKTTHTIANASLWYLKYPSFPVSYMNEFVDVEFEGHSFKAIKEYDGFLKGIYGDYMKLPPLNERTPRHTYKAYWKE